MLRKKVVWEPRVREEGVASMGKELRHARATPGCLCRLDGTVLSHLVLEPNTTKVTGRTPTNVP
jgi:hypothetical protein